MGKGKDSLHAYIKPNVQQLKCQSAQLMLAHSPASEPSRTAPVTPTHMVFSITRHRQCLCGTHMHNFDPTLLHEARAAPCLGSPTVHDTSGTHCQVCRTALFLLHIFDPTLLHEPLAAPCLGSPAVHATHRDTDCLNLVAQP
eukprot:scaffold50678_cov17-Tisochrysis_lutea.AAC.1